jgi:[ribosomal protein S5]-alanine N-acetyltransferase
VIYHVGDFCVRHLNLSDCDTLYIFKNDPEIMNMLGGFSTGYSLADIEDWIELHRQKKDEIIWAIAEKESSKCIGHVGLYQIDHRVGKAEFGIIIGDKSLWGKGLGSLFTRFAVEYAFDVLNLNRIQLSVIETNTRAYQLYKSLNFKEEGRLRRAQYKKGQYVDVYVMGLLKEDYYKK